VASPLNTTVMVDPVKPVQEPGGRTKPGECRLNQVNAHENRQPQPGWSKEMREAKADEDHGPGENSNKGFGLHKEELKFDLYEHIRI
jgi:hypothetical protein